MLYILPPPSNPSPPSVWDLIINFHRKGCQESETTVNDAQSSSIKFICKGQQPQKIRRSWCKTTPPSSPSSSTNHFNNVSERRDNEKKNEMKKAKVHSVVVLCWPQKWNNRPTSTINFTFTQKPDVNAENFFSNNNFPHLLLTLAIYTANKTRSIDFPAYISLYLQAQVSKQRCRRNRTRV